MTRPPIRRPRRGLSASRDVARRFNRRRAAMISLALDSEGFSKPDLAREVWRRRSVGSNSRPAILGG